MDQSQWLLLAYVAKFGVLNGTFWLAGLCLVQVIFGVGVAVQWRFGLWVLTAVSSWAVFALTAGVLMDSVGGMTDLTILGIVWDTPVGTALALRAGGLGLVFLSFFPTGKTGDWFGGLGALVLLASFVVSGHIASQAHIWLSAILLLHVCVAALWIGILLPLHNLAKTHPEKAQRVGQQFARNATLLVPAMIVAGGIMAWQLVGSFEALFASAYGRLLLVKVAGVAAVLLCAALNKLRFVPALGKGNDTAADRFAQSLEVEIAAVIFVLGLTAALTSFGGP
jgi:putative copper resistance protein D